MSRSTQITRRPFARLAPVALLLLAAALPACDREGPLAPPLVEPRSPNAPAAPGRVIGVVEVTISGLGTGEVMASALSAPSIAALEELRASRDRSQQGTGATTLGGAASHGTLGGTPAHGAALHTLSFPANLDATGDGTIQLRPISSGSFTSGVRGDGERYLQAVFQVRNATTGGTAYDTPRQNLTFLAVATDATLQETAISSFALFNGDPANAALARQILPTGDLTRNTTTGEPAATGGDVFQAFTESALAALVPNAPAGVSTILPYGFVVRAPGSADLRTLPASPAPGAYDGLVTFAFRLPLQASASDDPYTISATFLAVDDTETRTTESLEEQGTTHLANRAQALGPATMVTLLGGSNPAVPAHGIDRICRLRTAGTDPNAPAATLIDQGAGCAPGAVSLPDHVIVVDRSVASTTGNGRTWATAFKYLQDALACVRSDAGPGGACEDVAEIWVAEGSHYPDEGAGLVDNDRGADIDHPVTFELVPDIALYGGFAGYERSRQQRDWQARTTVLDGDIDQDGTATGNAYRIATMHATGGAKFSRVTVLDGFTVTGAEGTSAIVCLAEGAGSECSPLLRNLIVTGNTANTLNAFKAWGGGMTLRVDDNATAAPFVDGVTFSNNFSTSGGGLWVFTDSTGGQIALDLVRTSFVDNGSNAGEGGAINVWGYSSHRPVLRMHNASLRSNRSGYGGAIAIGGAVLEAANIEIWNNQAQTGGAIFVGAGGELILSGATIGGNVSTNSDPFFSGVIHINWDEPVLITNSIIWGNTPRAFGAHHLPEQFVLNNVIVQGGCPEWGVTIIATCTDVQSANPVFRDLPGGDLRLGSGSPAIDAGTNVFLGMDIFDLNRNGNTSEPIPFDVAGLRRVVDWAGTGTARVDLGAHETQR